MENKFVYKLFLFVLVCACAAYAGCQSSKPVADNASRNRVHTFVKNPMLMAKPALAPYCNQQSGWNGPPPSNALITFGKNGTADGSTCVNAASLCSATAYTGQPITPGGFNAEAAFTVAQAGNLQNSLWLSMVISNYGYSFPKNVIDSSLINYFSAFGPTYGGAMQFTPCVVDPKIIAALGLPANNPMNLGNSPLVYVSAPNTDPNTGYIQFYFIGLLPGCEGNLTMAAPGTSCDTSTTNMAICSVTASKPGNPNPVFFNYFNGYYSNCDESMSMFVNINNLIAQQPQLKNMFPMQNGMPASSTITLGQDFTFPGDSATVTSTGVPGGWVIPAGTYPFTALSTINYPSNTPSFSGWIQISIDSVGVSSFPLPVNCVNQSPTYSATTVSDTLAWQWPQSGLLARILTSTSQTGPFTPLTGWIGPVSTQCGIGTYTLTLPATTTGSVTWYQVQTGMAAATTGKQLSANPPYSVSQVSGISTGPQNDAQMKAEKDKKKK